MIGHSHNLWMQVKYLQMKASQHLMPGSEKSSDAKNSSIFGLGEHFLPKKQKWPKRGFFRLHQKKKNWKTFLRQQMRKNILEKDLETAASFLATEKIWSKSSQEFF